MDENNNITTEDKVVLIVEDEKPMAKTLNLKLQKAGFNTMVANDGQTALDILNKNKIDLVLLDLIIPQIDGFAVLKELKKRKETIPIIVISNLGQEDDMNLARDLGVVDYFIKVNTPMVKIVDKVKACLNEGDC
jgi:two-component system, OmpR family, alkaline phosphatase synthesis response regulator PhoP